jgi:transposase
MFFPEGQIRVQLYGRPCDMRKSFDGLQALVRHVLGEDPLNGSLYVFINRRATQMRVLYFDRSGFCVWAKRLEAGRFVADWSQVRSREMDWTGLKLMLEGIEPGKQRKRYQLPQKDWQKSLSTIPADTISPLQCRHASSVADQHPEPG